ncbi:hypothetical protein SeMB42_g03705 [Synchytrium endobioticum]|uniref:RecQ-mediated genome instability protein 1 n=1 Tax=Synchytrium endobioticum TaxID=286115 RepID=A0A507D2I2_9FUNG|nr:hypothetical protein SeLEV6574_g03856 [Synchytrium endobioticum]TPX46421.1 hypothetical protein SeMB42_g03705 [Synchytrium endobioticum]
MDEPPMLTHATSYLRSKACLAVSRSWLLSTLSTHPPPTPHAVYTAYLSTDLSLHATPSITPDVATRHKERLKNASNGSLCLVQLEDVMEIGCSYLDLLDQVRDLRDSNKAIRRKMLRLVLTDGVQSVKAMEVEVVAALALLMPLKTKMLLKNIEIRRGVLCLNPRNVEVLGGGVPYDCSPVDALERKLRELIKQQQLQRSSQPGNPQPPRQLGALVTLERPPPSATTTNNSTNTHNTNNNNNNVKQQALPIPNNNQNNQKRKHPMGEDEDFLSAHFADDDFEAMELAMAFNDFGDDFVP